MYIFVVPMNGQALLGMPDSDRLNIIKINIDSIGAVDIRDSEGVKTHTLSGSPNQIRKQMVLRSATQTWTAFQN